MTSRILKSLLVVSFVALLLSVFQAGKLLQMARKRINFRDYIPY